MSLAGSVARQGMQRAVGAVSEVPVLVLLMAL